MFAGTGGHSPEDTIRSPAIPVKCWPIVCNIKPILNEDLVLWANKTRYVDQMSNYVGFMLRVDGLPTFG